jgi:DHA1 family bicyclomycin/chloramphenicol resistance-like MFS transporter
LQDARFLFMCLSIGFMFSGIPLYIGSAASFVMDLLHLPETAFAWLFVPLISGVVIGSATAQHLLKREAFPSERLIRGGMLICIAAALWNIAYTSQGAISLPWAVLPIALYTFGMALATPSMVIEALNRLPSTHGLSASLQGFIQMMIFTLVAGIAAPLLFDSALKLALGMCLGIAVGIALWIATHVGRKAVAR